MQHQLTAGQLLLQGNRCGGHPVVDQVNGLVPEYAPKETSLVHHQIAYCEDAVANAGVQDHAMFVEPGLVTEDLIQRHGLCATQTQHIIEAGVMAAVAFSHQQASCGGTLPRVEDGLVAWSLRKAVH